MRRKSRLHLGFLLSLEQIFLGSLLLQAIASLTQALVLLQPGNAMLFPDHFFGRRSRPRSKTYSWRQVLQSKP